MAGSSPSRARASTSLRLYTHVQSGTYFMSAATITSFQRSAPAVASCTTTVPV